MIDRNRYTILGLHETRVGPLALLGLRPDEVDARRIKEARDRQLSIVAAHPWSTRREGVLLRDEINAAAQLLLDPAMRDEIVAEYERQSRTPSGAPAPFEMVPAAAAVESEPEVMPGSSGPTEGPRLSKDRAFRVPAREFVDDLMAAWVSSGGWNSRARHRIVAAGARHGIEGEALLNVIVRLPELIRATHGVEAPASGRDIDRRSTEHRSPQANHAPREEPLFEARASILADLAVAPVHVFPAVDYEAMAARDAQRNFAAAMTTFIICALVNFPLAVWVLKEIFFPSGPTHFLWEDQPVAVRSVEAAPTTNEPAWTVDDEGNPIKMTTPAVSPMSASLIGEINALERDLLAAPELDADLLTRLSGLGLRGRRTWITMDPTGWQRIADCMATAIYQHGQTHMNATAIIECVADPGAPEWSVSGVYSRAWSGGLLLYLSRLPDLPEESITVLRSRLGAYDLSGLRSTGRSMTIQNGLGIAVQSIATTLARGTNALTEAGRTWLAWRNTVLAVSKVDRPGLGSGDSDAKRDEWFLDAATHVLVSGPDVSSSPNALPALSVLLSQVNWVDRGGGRRRVLAWCDDGRISAADLSIVTAFLVGQANVPGLDDSLVMAPEADAASRAALRQRLGDAWSVNDESAAVTLSRSDLVDWVRRVDELAFAPAPVGNHLDALAHLVTLSQWNDAANLLWHGRSTEAELVLTDLQPALAEARLAGPDPRSARKASSFGGDDRFPIEFSRAKQLNDRAGMKELIAALGVQQPEVLGPITSEFLVDLALGSGTRETRIAALGKIESTFASNPTVVFALADNLIPDRRDGRLSVAIENITGVKLPSIRSEEWYAAARIALISHTARLRGLYDEPTPVDAMIGLLATSYARQVTTMVNSVELGPVSNVNSHDVLSSAQRLFDVYLVQARPMQPRVSVPAPLEVIVDRARTRAAFFDEPVGAFMAWQAGVLELSAYVTVAERPASAQVVRALLDRATYDQIIARGAIEQLIALERAQTILWMVRFGMPPADTTSPLDNPMFVADQAPTDTGLGQQRFADQLANLSPSDPTQYFLLGEEAADVGADEIATRLYVLSAALDRERWARSACLALADMLDGRETLARRAELRAVATLLEDDAFVTGRRADVEAAHAAFRRSASMISTMLGFYRRGEGAKALAALQFDDATQSLVERFGRSVGSLGQILSFCRSYPRCPKCHNKLVIKSPADHDDFIICPVCLGTPGEDISEEKIAAMIRLEIALQAGRDAPWDMRFELDGYEMRTVLDPILLPRWFGIDVGRTVYREGRWVQP